MPRPKKCRQIRGNPVARFYKPQGIRTKDLEIFCLKEEEFEALSLVDYQGLSQEEAAMMMQISRPTFSRIINSARKTIASALVKGGALKIEGGDFNRLSDQERTESCQIKTKQALSDEVPSEQIMEDEAAVAASNPILYP